MLTLTVFIIFYNFCYFFGKSSLIFIEKLCGSKIINTKVAGVEISTFYSLIFLILIGNIAFIVNFFLPTKYLLYIVLPLLFLNFFSFRFYFGELNNLLLNSLISFVVGISSFGIGFSYDAGLYHLNNQAWISQSKIVIGIVNIYYPYGWSSIYEYISSVLIFVNNYVFLHFLNLSFIVLFFAFIYKNITKISDENNFLKLSSVALLTYGFLDNFGFEGGRNGFIQIQGIGKFDTPFGILFLIFSLLVMQQLLKDEYKKSDLILFTFFTLFLIQIKLSGLVFILLYSFYLYKYLLNKEIEFKKITNDLKSPILIAVLWILKNILTSGCLIFYIEQSCISALKWYEPGTASFAVHDTKTFNLGYSFDLSFSKWSNLWFSNQINKTFLQNFILSLLFLLLIRMILFKKNKSASWKTISYFNIYIYTSLLIWIYGAPDPRFGSGIFMLIISSLFLNYKLKKLNILKKSNEIILKILLVSCLLLVPRADSYKTFIDDSHFNLLGISIPNTDYIDNNNWGVNPKNDDRCWVNLLCNNIKNEQLIEKNKFKYKIFTMGF